MNEIQSKRGENSRGRDGCEDFRKGMQHVDDVKGGLVWVRNEIVQKLRDSLSTVVCAIEVVPPPKSWKSWKRNKYQGMIAGSFTLEAWRCMPP